MTRKNHLINIHTSTGTTAPTGASLYLGEIAVQHTPNDPGLWIKMGTSESSTEYEKFIGKTEITNLINQSNILGSGYTYSGLPYVNSATTLADAYSALTNEMIKDGQVVAAALNDLNVRVDEISAATGDNTELLEYIQENEEVVAGALNNLNERVGVVETHMTGDYIPITGYQTATGTSEEELSLEETDTVNEALGKLQKQMLDNEESIAAGLNDLNTRLDNVDELIAHNTGVTQLSGAVKSLSAATDYGFREAFGEMSRLSSATRSLSSATQTFAKATLTVNLNGVEQGKYTPWSGNTVIDLTAVTNGSDVLLTGYELATGTTEEELAVVATDTVNEAFGKIQKQNYDNEAVVAGALNDLDERITFLEVSGSSSDDLEELSGAVVSKEIVVAAALNDLNSRIVELSGNTGGGGGGTDVAPLSAAVLSLSAAVVTISGNSGGGGSSDPNAITGITMNGSAVSVSNHVASLGTVLTDSSNFITALGTNENYLTYTKNGSANNITVPFATKSSQDEDGHLLKHYYIPYNAVVNPTNNFSSCQLFSSQINDAFYALDKRKTITFSGFQSSNAAQLFNNNYNNTGTVIAAGGTGIITIGSESDAAFVTYPYGPISLSFYIESTKGKPSSISIRAYGTKSNTVGWYDYDTFTNEKTPNGNNSNAIFTCNNNNIYNIKCWEITIVAHDTLPTVLSEIYAIFKRSNGEVDQSVVTKFSNKQTLYGEIVIDNNITSKSFIKSGGTSSQFLKADGSVDNNSYITGYTETDPTVPSWAKASTKPTYTASEVGALPTGTTLDGIADGATRKLSNYATTGTVNTLNNTVTAHTGNTNIHVTTAQTAAWNGKQDAINDLAEIRSNAASGMAAYNNVNALSAATTAMSVNVGKIAVTGVTVTGTGNAVTNAAYSNSALTLTKGNVLTAETLTGVSLAGTAVTLSNKVAPIPSASSSAFGVVKTGNFISNNNGTIAVSTGTTNATVARGDQFLAVSGATTANTGNINTLSSATRAHTATTIANGTSSQMHLPTVSASDNGKILMVKNGAWVLEEPSTITYSSSAPSGGKDGDIWIQTS